MNVNDMIYYTASFVGASSVAPLRFVNKQWNESVRPIPRKGHQHVYRMMSSVPLYDWAREVLGMPNASRLETFAYGSLELVTQQCARWPDRSANDCSYAARYGNLVVLKWLRAQDPPCPWDADACAGAAINGNLDVLKMAEISEPALSVGRVDMCVRGVL